MKVFVTGVGGQLGHDVMNELHKRGYVGVGSDITPVYSGIQDGSAVTMMPYVSMDITDAVAVDRIISKICPDVVIHCAAWTAVDLAEEPEVIDKVRAINVGGTQNIANACKKNGCKMNLFTIYRLKGMYAEDDLENYNPFMRYLGYRGGYTYTVQFAELQNEEEAKNFTDILNKYIGTCLPFFEYL